MFYPGSRYEKTGTYTVTTPSGQQVAVAILPQPRTDPVAGYHRRLASQRLDLIANFYLKDATTFWRLCDANNSVVPDALANRDLIGIPAKTS